MRTTIFSAFSERSFLYLWFAEVFTQIASNLFNFYLILIVFSITKSNTAVSAVVISFMVPAILFGIIAGVYVDHWDKKKVLYATNIIRAVLLFILALFHRNLVLIYAISFAFSFATQFFIPAESPLIPQLVKPKLLFSANALFGIVIFGSIFLAYVLAGPFIIYFGHVNTLFILSTMMVIGAVCIYFIKPQKGAKLTLSPESIRSLSIKEEIQSAFSLMLTTKEIYHSLFLLALTQILVLIIASIAPGYASEVLKMKVEEFPLIFVAPGALGMLVGAIVLVHYFHEYSKERLVTAGLFVSGIAMLFLPLAPVIASKHVVYTINDYLPRLLVITKVDILVVISFFLGLANALVFVPSNTILQEKTSDEIRGKIYGVLNSLVGVFSLLPIILVGSLADLIGVGHVIVGLGIVLIVLGFLKVAIK